MAKTVVILGAGLAGLPVAHYLLKHTSKMVSGLRVILVSPNDQFYWNLASVRAAVPGQITEDKLFFPIPELFAKYPSEKFEFVPGKAETLNPQNNSVVVSLNAGSKRILEYHTIIVATGSDAKDNMPWKHVGTQTRAALTKLQEDVKNARSIVVGGAGSTGVEFAGELGSEYAKAGTKKVTIISSDSLPLEPLLMDSVREAAKNELEKLNVTVITGSKVTKISESGSEKIIELTKKDGTTTTLKTDLYVPTHGVVYNTSFAPFSMLDNNTGRLKQDVYLRAPGYTNVFILGDVGNLEYAQASSMDAQVRHLIKQLDVSYFKPGSTLAEYKPTNTPDSKVTIGITIGRDRGTGQMGTWKVFSIMIWWFKGRYMGTNYAHEYAAGLRTLSGKLA